MATNEENTLASRLVDAFKARDPDHVARLMNRKPSVLYDWISGEGNLPVDALRAIVKMTNVDLNWLLIGAGTPGGNVTRQVSPDRKSSEFAEQICFEDVNSVLEEREVITKLTLNRRNIPIARTSLRTTGKSPKK